VVWTVVGAEVRPSVRVVLEALRASAADLVARFPSLTLVRPDAPPAAEDGNKDRHGVR